MAASASPLVLQPVGSPPRPLKVDAIERWSDLFDMVPANHPTLHPNRTRDEWLMHRRNTELPPMPNSPRTAFPMTQPERPQPPVNYDAVDAINAIAGLREGDYDTSVKAHDEFIRRFATVTQPTYGSHGRIDEEKQHHNSRTVSPRRSAAGAGAAGPAVPLLRGTTPAQRRRRKLARQRAEAFAVFKTLPYQRDPAAVRLAAVWAKREIPAFAEQPLFVLLALMETARYDSIRAAGQPLPGDFVGDLCGVVLQGCVDVGLPAESFGQAVPVPVVTDVDAVADDPAGPPVTIATVPLQAGMAFGPGFVQAARVVTSSPASFLFFRLDEHSKATQKMAAIGLRRKQDALLLVPKLQGWGYNALEQLCHLFSWVKKPSGTVISRQNEPPPFFAFIIEGECDVLKDVKLADSPRGVRVCLGQLGPGSYFGELNGLSPGDPGSTRRLSQILQVSSNPMPRQSIADAIARRKVPSPFTIRSKTELVLLVLPEEHRCKIDPLFVLQFLAENPHNFTNVSDEEVTKLYMQQAKDTSWHKLKRDIMVEVLGDRI